MSAPHALTVLAAVLVGGRDQLAYVVLAGVAVSARAGPVQQTIQGWRGSVIATQCRPSDRRRPLACLARALGIPADSPTGPADVLSELRAAASADDLLLILEDLHWADDQTLAVLEETVKDQAAYPVVILATVDPDQLHPSVENHLALLQAAGLLEQLRVDAEPGAPLVTPAAPGETESAEHIGRVEVVESLGRDTKYLLGFAALLGSPFSMRLLCAVTRRSMTDLLPQVSEALEAGILDEAGPSELAFASESMRRAIARRLPAAVRAELHRDIALHLEGAGSSPARVAHHLQHMMLGSEDVDRVARVARQLTPDDANLAVLLWRRAHGAVDADDPRRVHLEGDLAWAELAAGQLRQAEQTARLFLRRTSDPEQAAPLRLCLSAALFRQRRWAEAQASAEEAASAPGMSAADRADQVAMSGAAALLAGDVDRALEFVARAERVAGMIDARMAQARSAMVRGRLAYQRGVLSAADEYFRVADRLGAEEDSTEAYDAGPHVLHALALSDMDRFDEAKSLVDIAVRGSRRLGATAGLHLALVAKGCLALDEGRLQAGTEALDAGLQVLEDGAGLLFPLGIARRALVSLQTLGVASSDSWLARLPHETAGSRSLGVGWVHRAVAMTRLRDGSPEQAFAHLRDGWRLCIENDLQSELAVLATEVADAAWQAGERDLAGEVAGATERVARLNPTVPVLALTAAAARALSTDDEGMLLDVAQNWRRSSRRLQVARITEQVAYRLSLLGMERAGSEFAEFAAEEYTHVGASADERAVRDWLTARSGHGRLEALGRDPAWDGLTRTERLVAEYVERGRSNSQIAKEMVISRRTVETHVSHVLAKLGLRSRSELVLAAARRSRFPAQLDQADQPAGRGSRGERNVR